MYNEFQGHNTQFIIKRGAMKQKGEVRLSYKKKRRGKTYQERGLAVLFMRKIYEYWLLSLRSARVTPATWATPLEPIFRLVDRICDHISELSRITGTVFDMSFKSYKESIAQELAAHLIIKHTICISQLLFLWLTFTSHSSMVIMDDGQ